MKMIRWVVSVEVKHTTQLPARNNLKYVIKKIGDQSADKASDNDENDVERNEENKMLRVKTRIILESCDQGSFLFDVILNQSITFHKYINEI